MTTTTYISTTDTAKLIRQALKVAFPGTKFSVKSDKYANGSSIDIAWQDGPCEPAVKEIASQYEGSTFDGMIDLKSPQYQTVATAQGFAQVHYGADFVFTHRSHSRQLIERALIVKCAEYGWPMPKMVEGWRGVWHFEVNFDAPDFKFREDELNRAIRATAG